jgi:hypothetical protein
MCLVLKDFKGQDMHIELPKSLAGAFLNEIVNRMEMKVQRNTTNCYTVYFAVTFDILIRLTLSLF